jgi:GxxExxY protein
MIDLYLKDETYKIIGLCMEVHKILGKGHSEIIYKEALEYEFSTNGMKGKKTIGLNIKKSFFQDITMQILWCLTK